MTWAADTMHTEATRSQAEAAEAARLAAVRDSRLLVAERAPRIARFVASAGQRFGKPLSCLSVLDDTTQHVRFGSKELLGTLPRDQSICQHLIAGPDDTMVVEDTRSDPRAASFSKTGRAQDMRFYAGSVLRARGGYRIGTLCIADREPGRFSAAEVATLRRNAEELERIVEEHGQKVDTRELLAELWAAMPIHDVPLHFQPIVRGDTMSQTGFEALLRWRRRDGTPVQPDLLFPLLERTGLVFAIDRAVLRTACRHAATFPNGLRVSVNVSASWFRRGRESLVHAVHDALSESGLEPGRLLIEVTEQMMIADERVAADTLENLKRLGVQLALDDFGTGYASLASLASYPFDVVKLDRSFVRSLGRNPKAEKVILCVMELGKALGMRVCAEGVETESQLAFLRAHNCDRLQGYLVDSLVAGRWP